ncbi:N-acetyltransferase family protein [Pseudonocardia sp. CA-107938]|uniref:GNAT family N-acetyltransferase n=1 Tax=Pseudonocardia sp. CA-107938 TaxID=3240021 RepID=UPI003D8E443D
MDLILRPAVPSDVATLHRFVVELAATEEFPGEVTARPDGLTAALFGPAAVAEAVVAEVGGVPAGFALHYPTYSTIVGRPGIHLEDLYVAEEFRGAGIGLALLRHLAELTVARGGGRLEWWVLRTNEPALRFYRRLAARGLDEIEVMRLDGDALTRLVAAP